MKHKLFKLSEPGWELEFDTMEEVEYKLLQSICNGCREEAMDEITTGDGTYSNIENILATTCGCEFDVE